MNFFSRRTSRVFKDIEVEKDKINEIMKVATLSPTGRNLRAYEFIVVDDKELISKLSKAKKMGSNFAEKAPLLIVIASKDVVTWSEDCSIAATMIQLKAHDLGLSSCWIQTKDKENVDGVSTDKIIKETLNIPNDMHIGNIVAIGYSNENLPSYTEKDCDMSKVHYNKF